MCSNVDSLAFSLAAFPCTVDAARNERTIVLCAFPGVSAWLVASCPDCGTRGTDNGRCLRSTSIESNVTFLSFSASICYLIVIYFFLFFFLSVCAKKCVRFLCPKYRFCKLRVGTSEFSSPGVSMPVYLLFSVLFLDMVNHIVQSVTLSVIMISLHDCHGISDWLRMPSSCGIRQCGGIGLAVFRVNESGDEVMTLWRRNLV